jgi:hypothetical protein
MDDSDMDADYVPLLLGLQPRETGRKYQIGSCASHRSTVYTKPLLGRVKDARCG